MELTNISKAQIVGDVDGLAAQVTDIIAQIKAAEEAVVIAQANLDQLRIEKYRLEGEHRAIARLKSSMEPVTEKVGA
jgi:hypothetical protein